MAVLSAQKYFRMSPGNVFHFAPLESWLMNYPLKWQHSSAGIEWSLDNDASNTAVLVASEAHAITLAVEGLLGVVFTVAALTDEAVDVGEVVVVVVVVFYSLSLFTYILLLFQYISSSFEC